MKFVLVVCLVALAFDAISSVSVVIKNDQVYVDDKPLDLRKLEMIEDRPTVQRYLFRSGDTNITITKSKIGNALSVSTVSKMTPEEIQKAKELQKQMAEQITNKVKQISSDIENQMKTINDQINLSMQNAFKGFSPFGFGYDF